MKEMAKSVGKKCDDCHETEAFDKDTEKKVIARGMMKMTEAINSQLGKDKFEDKVTCNTCHRGKEKPDR
jgi:cytochrome c peroxidase